MNGSDDEFLKSLLSAFRGEAEEHLQAISTGLLELEGDPGTSGLKGVIEGVYREAHSLKGAARAVSQTAVEALCQTLESVFAKWKNSEWRPAAAGFDVLQHAVDLIQQLIATGEQVDAEAVAQMLRELDHLPAESPSSAARDHTGQADHVLPVSRAAGTIRIATEKLDGLILRAEEMLAVKLAAVQRAVELRELEGRVVGEIREWLQHRTEDPGMAYIHVLRDLAGRLAELSAVATASSHDTGRMVDELLEGVKALSMLPCGTLLSTLPKTVRDLSRDQDKEAELVVTGGEVEIGKRILEQMKDPLTHLVRNAVDHGIEKPDDRERLGKQRKATISISVRQVEGNKVEIMVADDGAGIDVEAARSAAVEHGNLSAGEAEKLNAPEVLALTFMSGFSTARTVTEISGRGLGLAIVREKVEELGGRVTVQTRKGKGTSFRILLPLILSTCEGTLVRSGNQTFVVPAASVEHVGRIRKSGIQMVANREIVSLAGQAMSLVRLADVLAIADPRNAAGAPDGLPYIVISAGETRIAFVVEEILDVQEVLVKPLEKPLVRVRNIAGITILGSGQVALVLNVSDLLASAINVRLPDRSADTSAGTSAEKSLLLVEDSITSRMLLKNILESAGYRVRTAVDGLDAVRILKEEHFDGVVSDVEMPRLNGFHLTRRIRADRKLSELPVVLVTALGTAEDRERGVDAGANAYIIKSSFDQSNLLDALRQLV